MTRRSEVQTTEPFKYVGKSVPRTDVLAKVTGVATYGIDVRFPDMLVAKMLRAGVPHARIKKIDTSGV